LSVDDVWKTLNKETEGKKREKLIQYACKQGKKLFESKAFESDATKESIKAILKEDNLAAPEIVIFEAVAAWAKHKSEKTEEQKTLLSDVLPLIRFPTMTSTDLATKVVPTGLLELPVTLELFAYIGAKDSKSPIQLGSSTKQFSSTPRRAGGAFVWRKSGTDIQISDDGLTATPTQRNGTIFGTCSFISGKHSWTIEVLTCRGNCLDIGVSTDGKTKRIAGLHANGTSIRLQNSGERSNGTHRWARFVAGTKVTVQLDMNAKTLGFIVDGKPLSSVITNLPGKVYPAVDFREKNLSIKLLTEMEIDWSGVVIEK